MGLARTGTALAGLPTFIRPGPLALFCLLSLAFSPPSHAIRFPDTADLKKSWTVGERTGGRPSLLYRKARGDSSALRLEWGPQGMVAARYDQPDEIESDSFAVLTSAYGNGAAWHENPGRPDSAMTRLFPGLEQEWTLKGFAGETGWLGSGLYRGRFFLAFRAEPPIERRRVAEPLRLLPSLGAFLDTSSEWLHVPCKPMPGDEGRRGGGAGEKTGKPVCFGPGDDARWIVRIRPARNRQGIRADIWHEEPQSPALAEIRRAVTSVPDALQHEYARDLAGMLEGEARMFLVKAAQRLPAAFNWPSWQLQDFRDGAIPYAEYLPLVRRQANPGEFLAAFRSDDAGLFLQVDLYYRGTFHLTAESKP